MSDSIETKEELNDAEMNEVNKTRLIRFGIFSLVVLVLFGILSLFNFLTRSKWEKGLRLQVQTVLDAHGETCSVGEILKLHTGLTAGCAVYELSGGERDGCHAVIIRVATFYGPMPAVYIYDSKKEQCDFIAFATLEGRAKTAIESLSKPSQVSYWARRIPKIMSTVESDSKEAANE
jgi:hypothetical protein